MCVSIFQSLPTWQTQFPISMLRCCDLTTVDRLMCVQQVVPLVEILAYTRSCSSGHVNEFGMQILNWPSRAGACLGRLIKKRKALKSRNTSILPLSVCFPSLQVLADASPLVQWDGSMAKCQRAQHGAGVSRHSAPPSYVLGET